MDILDMKILGRLLNNCRESDRQIGMELGISGGAVGARIRKMRQTGVIEEYILRVEPPVLGYGILYFVVSGEDTGRIFDEVSTIGEPYFVVPCIGGVTVCGLVVKDGMDQKIEQATRLMRDVRVLTIFEAESTGFDSNLTKTDLEILGELGRDPRRRIEDIARGTGLSTKTVTRCLEKLQDNDRVQFTLVYDPQKIEDYIPHAVLTWIRGDMGEALDRLNEKFSGSYLQVPFVAKNQIVLFMYSQSIFEMDEITQRVREVKDVESADLFIPKKISFYQRWLQDAVQEFKKSPRLHIKQIR